MPTAILNELRYARFRAVSRASSAAVARLRRKGGYMELSTFPMPAQLAPRARRCPAIRERQHKLLRYVRHWFSESRPIAALALLLTLLSLTSSAHAVPPRPTTVPSAVAVGQTVTCQPTSTTRPQPTLPKGFIEQIFYRGCLNQPTAIS